MQIAAVTMVYNEALILPYFLRHYEYLDEIHVLYETDSTDNTLQLLQNAPNVVIEHCHVEGGNDAIDKTDLINQAMWEIKDDWVYVVDPDEFIFPPNETPHDFLSRQKSDVVRAAMFQVYRHRTERDLDPSLPIIGQRIHGDPEVFSAVPRQNRDYNAHYVKPIVVRPSRDICFTPGNHSLEGNANVSPEFYLGAHWNMADQAIALVRRMQMRARQSERQKALKMGWQNRNVTEEWIREECDRHLDAPIIEELVPVGDKSPAEIKALCNKAFIQKALITELRSQIKDRENQIKEREHQIIQITGSITWRIVRKLHRIIETIVPPKIRGQLIARLMKQNNIPESNNKEAEPL
jgi:hypothetical protein